MAEVPIDVAALMVEVRDFQKRWQLANHEQPPLIGIRVEAHRYHTVSISSGLAIRLTSELDALRTYFEVLPPDTMLRVLYELKRAASPNVIHPTE